MLNLEDLNITIKTLENIQEEIKKGNLDGWGFKENQLDVAINITIAIENIYKWSLKNEKTM